MNYSVIKKASYKEVNDFFNKDYGTIKYWSDGEGRGQSFYDILEAENKFLLRVEHFGFDDWNEPVYYFVKILNK